MCVRRGDVAAELWKRCGHGQGKASGALPHVFFFSPFCFSLPAPTSAPAWWEISPHFLFFFSFSFFFLLSSCSLSRPPPLTLQPTHSPPIAMHGRKREEEGAAPISDEEKKARQAKIDKYNAAKTMCLQQVSSQADERRGQRATAATWRGEGWREGCKEGSASGNGCTAWHCTTPHYCRLNRQPQRPS